MIRYFYHIPGEGVTYGKEQADFSSMLARTDSLLWVDMQDHGESGERLLADVFKFHPLAIEDTVSERSVVKLEEYDGDLFAVFKLLDYQGGVDELKVSEVDIFMGKQLVVTVHRQRHRVFDFLFTQALRNDRMMSRGADLLFHAIVDAVVDSFNITLDIIESQVDEVEIIVLKEPDEAVVREIFRLRRSIATLKRVAGPQREVILKITNGNLPLISDRARIYFRDIYDHVNRINEIADSDRESLIAALEVYFSSVSTKTNEIIRVLTVFTAIVMPATFLVGLWGMNFKYMPELEWKYGYVFFWVVLFVVTAGLLIYFRRRRWF